MDATSSYLNRNRLSALEQQMYEALKRAEDFALKTADPSKGPRLNPSVMLLNIRQALAAADRAASSSTEE